MSVSNAIRKSEAEDDELTWKGKERVRHDVTIRSFRKNLFVSHFELSRCKQIDALGFARARGLFFATMRQPSGDELSDTLRAHEGKV